jgi:2-polyprenyl-6-methoxyphenol hydroxylase-like FAD-dependent oxidoreductase
LLGQRGWNVAVMEKRLKLYPMPRAVHFDHEVARILQAAGLGEEIPIEDVNRTYERWFRDHGVAVALACPDFHVFGTGTSINDAAALVSSLRRALRPGKP